MRALLLAIVLVLAAPAAAAAGVSMTQREIPLHPGARTLAAAPPARFDLVGLHWQGTGAVLFRTRGASGRWSAWQQADADQRPDAASPENRLRGWHLGGLVWTGQSNAIRFRTRGSVTRLRAYYVESTVERTPARRLSVAGSPQIIPRSGWNADEAIRRAKPQYADAVHFAVVHHTAGSNDYTAAQSAAIVRGIEVYHVEGNGWNDIGYNFLVDRYGQIFEGRYGGIDKPVIGAHAEGFNTGSVGVAVLGSYGSAQISGAARRALVALLSWRLDVAHVDPLSTLSWPSLGNPRFPAGIPVFLRAISGHRDTGFTDCPGDALYAQLPEIAREVSVSGGPKLYAPKVAGKLGGPVRFTGVLNGETPWTVTVAGSGGTVVAQQSGVGPALDWSWDSSAAAPDRYTWTISGAGLRGASGTLGTKALTLAFQKPLATPDLAVPGGDPVTISYMLTRPATVTATLVDPSGIVVATLFSGPQPAGLQHVAAAVPAGAASGQYSVVLEATTAAGATVSAGVLLTVDATLASFAVSPAAISLARGEALTVTFTLAVGPVEARLDVKRGSDIVATPIDASFGPGPQSVSWDGTLADGTPAPDGRYTIALTVTDTTTTFVRTATVTVDSTPPAVTVVSAKSMRFRVSEPATAVLGVGTRHYLLRLKRAGPFHFWLRPKPFAYRLVVVDAAGNRVAKLYRTR
jgi:hypothetical protein